MDFGDLAGKAKEALKDNEDKVAAGLDKAEELITAHTSDSVDEKIESGVDKAKDLLGKIN